MNDIICYTFYWCICHWKWNLW